MIGLWLSHELCPYPPALFDSIELLKTANKADRASGLKEQFIPDRLLISTVMVVFDGGMLVQKIRWRLANFFSDTCPSYLQYVAKISSGKAKILVFDGYRGACTKNITHIRRKRHNCSKLFILN